MIQNSEKPIVITGSTAADQFGYHGCKDKPVRQLYYACDDASQGA